MVFFCHCTNFYLKKFVFNKSELRIFKSFIQIQDFSILMFIKLKLIHVKKCIQMHISNKWATHLSINAYLSVGATTLHTEALKQLKKKTIQQTATTSTLFNLILE